MPFETSAERATAQSESDQQVVRFVNRTRTMESEADQFIGSLTSAKNNLTAAKTASDAAVAANTENAVLATENAVLAAKLTELDAVLTQATALKNGIATLLA